MEADMTIFRLPILVVTFTLVFGVKAHITIISKSIAKIANGYDNVDNVPTEVTFNTHHELSTLEFYIDHGDGQRDTAISLPEYLYSHTYSRRGTYIARVTTVSTTKGDYSTQEFDVQVGYVIPKACYPMVVQIGQSYLFNYTYLSVNDDTVSKSYTFTSVSLSSSFIIGRRGETIENPCGSINKNSESRDFDISLQTQQDPNPFIPWKTVKFNLYGVEDIAPTLTTCKLDFGDLTHSTTASVPSGDDTDLIASWNHEYASVGDYTAVAYCWHPTTFVGSNKLVVTIVASLYSIIPTPDNPTVDLVANPPVIVKPILSLFLDEAPTILDTDIFIDWGGGEGLNDTTVFELTEGDNIIKALQHTYTTAGTFDISLQLRRAGSGDSYNKTMTVVVLSSPESKSSEAAPTTQMPIVGASVAPGSWSLVRRSSDQVIIDESTVRFMLDYTVNKSSTPPVPMVCYMEYGDGFVEDPINITFPLTVYLPWAHNFVKLGLLDVYFNCHDGKGRVQNLSTSVAVRTYSQIDYVFTYDEAIAVDGPVDAPNTAKTTFRFSLLGVKEVFPHLVTWMFGDGSPRMSRMFYSYKETYVYKERGLYNGSVVIWSPKGNFTYKFQTLVGVTNLTMNDTAGMNNATFQFYLSELRWKSFTGEIFFGDGTSERSFCDMSLCVWDHDYTNNSFYDVTTVISTDDVVERVTFPRAIFIDHPVNGLYMVVEETEIEQPPGKVTIDIGMYNGSYNVEYMMCLIDLGDEWDRRIRYFIGAITPEVNFTLTDQYTSIGEQVITVNCTNRVGEMILTATVEVTSECFGGTGIFEKRYSDPFNPLLILASADVEIDSRVKVLCKTKKNKPEYHWSLWTLDFEYHHRETRITVKQPERDSYEILKGTLGPLLYSLELNVTVWKDDVLHWMHGVTYLQIVGSPLVIKFNGAFIRATGNEEATVDVALLSYDPDIRNRDDYSMTFTWKCSFYYTTTVSQMEMAVLRNDLGFEILCSNFSTEIGPGLRQFRDIPERRRGYRYEVSASTLTKTSDESAVAYIQYTKGAPDISIECHLNCGKKRARGTPQMFEATCPYCFKDEFYGAQLNWTLNIWDGVRSVYIPADFDMDTQTDFVEDNPAALLIKKNTLEPCKMYRLKAYVLMDHREHPGEAVSDFVVNCPPANGTCYTTPDNGTAKTTEFQTICSGWLDDGYGPTEVLLPMAFIYKFYISQDIYILPLFQGAQALTPREPLPVIPGTLGGNYTVICRIFDALDDYAEFNTTVYLSVPVLHSFDEIGSAQDAVLTSETDEESNSLRKQLLTTQYSSSIIQTVAINTLSGFLDEVTDMQNSTPKKSSWDDVFDKYMVNREDKDTSRKITKTFSTFVDQVNEKWKNVNLSDGHGLESLAETLTTIMHKPDTVDFHITDQSTELIKSGAAVLDELTNHEPFPIGDKVDDVIFAYTGALDALFNKNTPSYQTADTVNMEIEGLGEEEQHSVKYMMLSEQARIDEEAMHKSRQIMSSVENSINTLLAVMLRDQTKGQRPKIIKRKGMSFKCRKMTARTLKNSQFDSEDFSMVFPKAYDDSMNVTNLVSVRTSVTKKNMYSYADDGSSYDITSPVLSVHMDDENGTDIFDGKVSLKIKRDMPEYTNYNINQTRQGDEGFSHHQFQVRTPSDSMFVFVDVGGNGGDVGLFYRYDGPPATYADGVKYVKGEYVTYTESRNKRRKKRRARTVVKWTFGPGALNIGFVYMAIDFGPMADRMKVYSVLIYADSCRVWDKDRNVWTNTSCKISPYSVPDETLCDCVDAPGHTFASSFYVPPNLINFDLVFSTFDAENAAVYGTLIGLFVVFGLAAVWAKRKGRSDERRWGVGYLMDNFVEDHYFYLLTVHTGLTGSSGTKSKVSFIITGQKGDTGVRLLCDGKRPLETGTVMTFILATGECLGNLKFLRIWHDNSGQGAEQSWYLSKFVVEDIQTNTRCMFVCDEWLAMDKADGLIDRVIPVAFEDDLMSFTKLFSEHNRVNVSDTHLWLSVLLRPEKSMFTRVQRVLTCLATLLLAMISSALFYQPEDAEGNSSNNPGTEVRLGAMRFSMTTLWTSTVGLLITVPPVILIVFLFKSRRPWTKQASCYGCCDGGDRSEQNDHSDVSESSSQLELSRANRENEFSEDQNLPPVFDPNRDPLQAKYEHNLLPSWILLVAWTLLALVILACSFFLVLYSMQWGKTVSEEWLASFVLSFFESIFILDPIKVILLSTVFAVFTMKPNGDPDSDKLSIDIIKEQSTRNGCTEIDPTILPPDPVPEDLLEKAKKKKREETVANTVFVELILYTLFVFCIFSVSYGNRDVRSYNLHNHIKNQLINPPFRKYEKMYYGEQEEALTWNKLRSLDDIYTWLNTTMLDTLFPWEGYNGEVLPWMTRLFIKDLDNYRVGPVRIRQARMPRRRPDYDVGSGLKNQENLFGTQERSPAYYINDEEDGEHCWRWQPTPCSVEETIDSMTASAWAHRSTRQEAAIPVIGKFAVYTGAGYVFDLKFNRHVITQIILNELRDNEWLNIQTRAVFIEFTLYNVNVNLLTSVRLAAEIAEYGGVFTWSDVKPMRIYDHTGGLGALMVLCQIISVLVTIFFVVRVVKKLRDMKLRFFLEAWNVLDLLIVTLCVVAFIMYVIRKVLFVRFMGKFTRNPQSFATFYEAALSDDIYGWILAAIVFLCTLRIMRILGYNKRILMIATVLKRASPSLFSFSVLFGVIIAAFMSAGYTMFHANLESFMTIWEAYVTILYLLMGKNVFKNMVLVSATLARIYFFFLAVIIVFLFLTIFQAILNFTITEVNTDVANAPVPYGVMDILHKFYASLVLDNRIVEQLKRWSKDDEQPADTNKSQDVATPAAPCPTTQDSDPTDMQKVFAVLRHHLHNTVETTKQLSLEDKRKSSKPSQETTRNYMKAISLRQVGIETQIVKQKKSANPKQKKKIGSKQNEKNINKASSGASIHVAGDAITPTMPMLKKARLPCPPPKLISKRPPLPLTGPGTLPMYSKRDKLEEWKPSTDSQPKVSSQNAEATKPKTKVPIRKKEPEKPKLAAPSRSLWAIGIKGRDV